MPRKVLEKSSLQWDNSAKTKWRRLCSR